jgi:long-chain acyl-CoA synthetase
MKDIPLYEVRQISSIKDMLDSSAAIYSSRVAFHVKHKGHEGYEPVTYKQFKNDVDSLGTALINLGLKDKRIAIISENRYEWAVSYLAIVNGTGLVVPLDKELPENEIENLLVRSKANAIIFSENKREHIKNISKRIDFIDHYIELDKSDESGFISISSLLEKGSALLANGDTSFVASEINTEAMSILLFTSATTDKAKAVMLSHRTVSVNLMAMTSMLYIDPSDIFLSILPLHHTYENTCGFLCPIFRGGSVAYCEGLRHILKNLQESKATVMLGVPLIFESIYKRIWDQAAKNPKMLKKLKFGLNLSGFLRKFGIDIRRKLFAAIHNNFGGSLRLFVSGAAGIDPDVAKGFRDLGITLLQGYGLTECSPIVALNRDVDYKDNAAGLPLPGVEFKIENPGADGVGEIIVRGRNIMQGYYENPEATAKVLKDGWFYTGDLGYMDSAKFVYITGRKKNVIVTKNGKNIYPEEIETLLNRSPYIKESMVYGKDDEVYGDVVVSASIVPDMDKIIESFEGRTLTSDEIHELIHKEVKSVNKSLVLYKYIKDFNTRENEFAKTTSQKIKRYVEN